MRNRVVVTGIGVISPIGASINQFWNAIISGSSGISLITSLDSSQLPVKVGGEVKNTYFDPNDFIPDRKRIKLMSRCSQLGVGAARLAVEDSDLLTHALNKQKVGVYMGSHLTMNDFDELSKLMLKAKDTSNAKVADSSKIFEILSNYWNPMNFLKDLPNGPAAHAAITYEFQGPCNTYATSSTGAIQAIGEAFKLIQRGDAEVMVAGGANSNICYEKIVNLYLLGLLYTGKEQAKAMRPFDINRAGFLLGEGAGVVVLEELRHTLKRKTTIYGEICGYSATTGQNVLLEDLSSSSIADTMRFALEDADISQEEVDYLNAFGFSTQSADLAETEAIKDVFQTHVKNLPISTIKPLTGNLESASGALDLIVSLLIIKNSLIPPIVNYEQPDPRCNLDFVSHKVRYKEVNVALINSFGFCGQNASLVIRKF